VFEDDVDMDADAELMLRVARGDRLAFASLYDRHQRGVAQFAFRFVGERSRAEELTQDIFVKLYRNASRYRPSAKFKTFLYRVAANHCLNEVRRGEYRVKHVSEGPEEGEVLETAAPEADGPDQQLVGRELEAQVGSALLALSDRERTAFTLCRFEGMAYKEIAEVLQASEAAVKSLIHRATLAVARKIDAFQSGDDQPLRSRA
jgi:RNA polymerase sigma-70 factor (ECF subfamily)